MADAGDDIRAELIGPWPESQAELRTALRGSGAERSEARCQLDEALDRLASAYGMGPECVEALCKTFTNANRDILDWLFSLAGEVAHPAPENAPILAQLADALSRGESLPEGDAPLTPEQKKLARMLGFAMDNPAHSHLGRGRPNRTDSVLILWTIRVVEDAAGKPFRFARPYKRQGPEGPMREVVYAGLRCLTAHFLLTKLRPAYGREAIASVARMMRREWFKAQFPEALSQDFIVANRLVLRGVLADL